jgi:hypothetical protein
VGKRDEGDLRERVLERGRGIRGPFGAAPRDVAIGADEHRSALADPERRSEGGEIGDPDVRADAWSFDADTEAQV